MTGPGKSTSQRDAGQRFEWARDALEVPQGADPRAHLLRCLAEQEFVLYGFQREAADVIWGRPGKPSGNGESAFEAARTQKLGEEIDRFAADFFSLPTGVRRQRWSELKQSPGLSPPQRMRLDHLQRALDVAPAFHEGTHRLSRLGELMAVVCELFVLAPPARARHRAAFLKRAVRDRRQWAEAAAELRNADSSLANLLPEFLSEVANLDLQRNPSPARRRKRRSPSVAPYPHTTRSGGRNWIWIVVALSVLSGVLRVGRDSRRQRYPRVPPVTTEPRFLPPVATDPPVVPPTISDDDFREGSEGWNFVTEQERTKQRRERFRKRLRDAGVNPESRRRIEREMDDLEKSRLRLNDRRKQMENK